MLGWVLVGQWLGSAGTSRGMPASAGFEREHGGVVLERIHNRFGGEPPPQPKLNPNSDAFLPQSTVLIVDDNPQNVELLQAFLESLPVKIVTAADGVEALQRVEEHNPDLILLDIMMPRLSGFQVCRKVKQDAKTRDIQVLMVTALNELGDIEQASECGTDDFVSKPVNKFELLTRVKSLLRVRHLKSELERALTYLNEIEHEDEELL